MGAIGLAVGAAVVLPFGLWSLAVAASGVDGVLAATTLCTVAASALAATAGTLLWRWQWAGDIRALWCSAAAVALGTSALAASDLFPAPRGGWGLVHATSLAVATFCLLRATSEQDVDVDRTASQTLLGPAVVVASSVFLATAVPASAAERTLLTGAVITVVLVSVVTSLVLAARRGVECKQVVPFVAVASAWVGVAKLISMWPSTLPGVEMASSLVRLSGASIALYGAVTGLQAAWKVAQLRGRGAALASDDRHRSRVHDTRNVLVGLEGAAMLLAREAGAQQPSEVGRLAEAMRSELDRLGSMLEPSAGAEDTSCDAVEVCRTQVMLLSTRGVTVELSAPTTASVAATASDVARIVQNLLVNATVHGGADLRGCRLEITQVGEEVLIAVEDRGAGLTPRRARQIMVAPVQSRRGRGLGLHGAVAIARANGGTLSYRKAAGGGARFCLRLPSGRDADHLDDGGREHVGGHHRRTQMS